jgi:hypothetical protein
MLLAVAVEQVGQELHPQLLVLQLPMQVAVVEQEILEVQEVVQVVQVVEAQEAHRLLEQQEQLTQEAVVVLVGLVQIFLAQAALAL